MNDKTGGPAFPHSRLGSDCDGMALRDWFAGMAMQGLLANPKLQEQIIKSGGANGGWIEESAYAWADAMLKQREAK